MNKPAELYVVARRVLLDALEALGPHREAVVLVGAQAVYLRVGEAELAVAPFTTDGDLAIDPEVLEEIPPLEEALTKAGFFPESRSSVGIWIATRPTSAGAETKVAVDLLVPASVSPGKGRSAKLPGHDSRAARRVEGLDGALVDADVMRLSALDEKDSRSFDVRVAGPAALLVAKARKIQDRQGTARLSDKDALDIFRLLRGTDVDVLMERFKKLLTDPKSSEPTRLGLELLEQQFSAPQGIGVEMTVRAVGPLMDPDEVAASCQALTNELLSALGAS
ncbi:GSU2403 family nucleotidyltransferase fold protein [Myxococcus faecalis]|uniref:GSU2403 family nucleotidyltransferase fold protein n=1 Tax=Myxococcus faecalis TaxID=3115646 RepID=UPI003CF6D5FE